MITVSNDYKSAIVQPKTIDAKITVGNSTITSDDINAIKRSFNTTLFKTIAKMVDIDSNTTIAKDTTIEPQFGLYIDGAFEYVSLGSYKTKDTPILNKDTNSYQITAYDKIIESMVSYGLTESDITYPCTVRELFVAIFTKLGWSTSGIPATFVNSTSSIEQDVFSNVNMTYRDVLDELCTISCMFLIDANGTPTLKQNTTTSETIDEEFLSDKSVEVGNQVFFNSLVFSRASESDNIYRKDDESITNNGLHEFKVSDLQILSLNWRDNFIDEMWNYIKTFTYYAFDINTNGITYLEPIDTFTLSIFGSTYSTILLNSDLTIGDGLNEKIYSSEPLESETEYKYADVSDRKLNQTILTVDKQQGEITALVSQVDTIETDISTPNQRASGTYIDIDNALDEPLVDFSIDGDTYQNTTTGKNLFNPMASYTTNSSSITSRDTNSITQKNSGTYCRTMWQINNLTVGQKYTLSCNYTNSSSCSLRVDIWDSTNNTQIIASSVSTNTSGSFTLTFEATETSHYVRLYSNTTGTSNSNSVVFSQIQFEKSSSKTSWEQFTNGPSPNPDYPQPIESVTGRNTLFVCGKNIFSSDLEQGTINGATGLPSNVTTTRLRTINYISVLPNTQYTLSINETNKTIYVFEYDGNYNFIQRIPNDWTGLPYTFTTSNITKNIKIVFRNNDDSDISPSNVTNRQLELGNTQTTYEPYQGITQEINLGKNLFDKNNVTSGSYLASDGTTTANGGWSISEYIPIEPNCYYTSTNLMGNSPARCYYDKDMTFISGVAHNNQAIITDKSPANAYYMRESINNTYLDTAQIEKGDLSTTYSNYFEPIKLNKIGDYQDYLFYNEESSPYYNIELQKNRWYLHKEIGKVVLNGSESWVDRLNYSYADRFVLNSVFEEATMYEMKSNYFVYDGNLDNTYPYISKSSAQCVVNFSEKGTTTLAQYKTWLSTHNTIVYYVLATPTDTEITASNYEELYAQLNNLLQTPILKGINHIGIDTENLQPNFNIEYVRDTALNDNFVKRPELNNYYTKTETMAQIQINNASIKQDVAELQVTVDNDGNAISTLSNQVSTLQTSTDYLITVTNDIEQNGVTKVQTSMGYKFDNDGLNVSRSGSTINTLIDNNGLTVNENTTPILFAGYNTDTSKVEVRSPDLISERATIGKHRCETYTESSEAKTGWFYVG